MAYADITISNKLGLHARAAGKLTQVAMQYQSDIRIHHKDKVVDAKSILAVMMLAAAKGYTLGIETSGLDEQEALSSLVQLIENKFDEDE